MTELRTRKPTGRVAFPLIQVDGEEKSGKSYALAALSGSPRVGRSFFLDLGDGTMDEYASLGDYELLETNGTFSDVLQQVELAAAVPSDPERPNVIGLDAGTLLWGLLKAKAERRARSSQRARKILESDPDADIDVTMTYWNDVKDDWARLLHVLKRFPGIGLVTAQGRYVSKVDAEGRPVRGQQEWSTDVEKTTHSWASALVRLTRDPREARLVGVRSLHVNLPTGGLVLPTENALDHLVFDILGAGGFGPVSATVPVLGVSAAQAKGRLLAAVQRARPTFTEAEAKAAAADLWKVAGLEGVKEVTEAQLAAAMPVSGEQASTADEKPPRDDEGDGEGDPPPSAPQTPPTPPQGDLTPPTPDDDEKVQEAAVDTRPVRADGARCHVTPQGAVLELEGQPVTADEATRFVLALLKPAAVTLAAQLNLSTAGKREDIHARIMEAWGLLDAPFDPPPADEMDSAEDPGPIPDMADVAGEPGDDLPEVQDVPEGWVEQTCFCGEPMMFEKGNYTKTKTHLDVDLDQEHPPEEPF